MEVINKYKSQYLRRTIKSKWYCISRAEKMNGQVLHWQEMRGAATTQMARDFCDSMIAMYLKRYEFYATGGERRITPLSQEEIESIKQQLQDEHI